MSVIVKLSKPITVGEESIAELELREPSVKEVRELGYPFIIVQGKSGGGGAEVLPDIIIKYAARLSGNPPSAFDAISMSDLSNLQIEIMSFFGGEA